MNTGKCIKTWIVDVKENLVSLRIKDYSYFTDENSKFCSGRGNFSIIDIFNECDELNDKDHLELMKENLPMDIWIGFLFIPNTKTIYIYVSLDYDETNDLANKIRRIILNHNSSCMKNIFTYAINMANKAYFLKNEIIIKDTTNWKYCDLDSNSLYHILSADGGAFPLESSSEETNAIPKYVCVTPLHFTVAVAKRHIITELNNKLEKGFDELKDKRLMNNNIVLLELKRKYIDFLNIDSESVSRIVSTKEKNEIYEDLCEHFWIEELNKDYLNKSRIFEDLVETEVAQKDIVLADTLNTIQIASIILTMIGWALVILQSNLPQGNLIYIFAILLGGCVSVILAIVIKRLVSK